MVEDPSVPPDTLSELLTLAARRAKDGQLATLAIAGCGGAVIFVLVLGRAGWLGAAAELAVGSFGIWGIADRELNLLYATPGSARGRVLRWRITKGVSAVTAMLAAATAFGAMFIPLFGRWKT